MLSKDEILVLYDKYAAKYEKLKDMKSSDVGYVSEKVEIKDILDLLEAILQFNPQRRPGANPGGTGRRKPGLRGERWLSE